MKFINYIVFTAILGLTLSLANVSLAQTGTTTATTTATTTTNTTATTTATTTTATSTDPTVGSVLRRQIQAKIDALLKQIEEIRILIKDSGNAKGLVPGQLISEKAKFKLERELKFGTKGEDVKLLQKILATDPTIYPGGFVTGNFGPLTQEAVRKLQNKLVIKSDGNLNAETLAKINEILTELGVEDDIPADLLSNRVKIEIKYNNGNQEVKIQVKPNNDSDDDDKEDDSDDSDESDDNDDDSDDEDDSDDDKDKNDDKGNDKSKSGKNDDSDDEDDN